MHTVDWKARRVPRGDPARVDVENDDLDLGTLEGDHGHRRATDVSGSCVWQRQRRPVSNGQRAASPLLPPVGANRPVLTPGTRQEAPESASLGKTTRYRDHGGQSDEMNTKNSKNGVARVAGKFRDLGRRTGSFYVTDRPSRAACKRHWCNKRTYQCKRSSFCVVEGVTLRSQRFLLGQDLFFATLTSAIRRYGWRFSREYGSLE